MVHARAVRGVLAAVLALTALSGAGCGSAQDEVPGGTGRASSGAGLVQTVTAEEAHALLTSDRDVLLDVRSEEEYEAEHIANARCLPLDQISEQTAAEAAPDKGVSVFVYCRTGVRSAEAAQLLASLGYERVYDMGGIVDWPYGTIKPDDESDEGTVENDQLPVGVKVVCG